MDIGGNDGVGKAFGDGLKLAGGFVDGGVGGEDPMRDERIAIRVGGVEGGVDGLAGVGVGVINGDGLHARAMLLRWIAGPEFGHGVDGFEAGAIGEEHAEPGGGGFLLVSPEEGVGAETEAIFFGEDGVFVGSAVFIRLGGAGGFDGSAP